MEKLYNFCWIFSKHKRKVWNIINFNGQYSPYCVHATKNPLNLLFFGNDSFSLRSLKSLNDTREASLAIRNIDVVTSSRSKSNPIAKYASENQLTCYHEMTADHIRRQNYDIGIVVSYGYLIPKDVIDAFPRGMINVHASLLPRWRGAAPIIYAIMNGDRTTGATIMTIKPNRFDTGEILAQRTIDIEPNVLMPKLHSDLAKLGADLLCQTVLNLDATLENIKPQTNDGVTYAPKIQPSIAMIDWTQMSAECIRRRFRALYKFKDLTTTFNSFEIRIVDIVLDDRTGSSISSARPSGFVEFVRSANLLRAHCADGTYVLIKKLAVKRKKVMSAGEFTNGYLNKVTEAERYFR